MAGMPYILATFALALTWFVFRIERFARQQSAVGAARAVLDAVLHGMVKGSGDQSGWGDIYITKLYDGDVLDERVGEARRVVFAEYRFDQVFVVPAEPVAAVATAVFPTGLLLESTRFAANTALWRLQVFNQLVGLETTFNGQHAADVRSTDTSPERREELAEASAHIVRMIHGDGIGLAAAPTGWYGILKEALEENVAHLDGLRGFSRRSYLREPLLAGIDLVALGAVCAAIVAYVVC